MKNEWIFPGKTGLFGTNANGGTALNVHESGTPYPYALRRVTTAESSRFSKMFTNEETLVGWFPEANDNMLLVGRKLNVVRLTFLTCLHHRCIAADQF